MEWQSRLIARYLSGRYRPPPPAEMQRTIAREQKLYTGHFNASARHTQQIEFFTYERDMERRELPAGAKRVRARGRSGWPAGRRRPPPPELRRRGPRRSGARGGR